MSKTIKKTAPAETEVVDEQKQSIATIPQENTIVNFNVENLMAKAIEHGLSPETMEKFLAMRQQLKAEWAKEQFNKAMAAFQSECPTIVKTKGVKTKTGIVAYKYAPIESIVEQVKPYLQKNGFSYSTSMEVLPEGVKVCVKTTHTDGHSEESCMQVPLGTKTEIMSQSQVTAAASTFAKRYAFCNAFGILTGDEDNDGANLPSEPVKPPYRGDNWDTATPINPAYQVPPKYQAKPAFVKLSLEAEILKTRIEEAKSKDELDMVALDIDFKKSQLSDMEIGKLRTAYKLRLDKLIIK